MHRFRILVAISPLLTEKVLSGIGARTWTHGELLVSVREKIPSVKYQLFLSSETCLWSSDLSRTVERPKASRLSPTAGRPCTAAS